MKTVVIVGPTGVGKTRLSVALAKRFDGEIINADSMQVYRGLNIGTAKITEEEKEGMMHHLFDICNVDEMYTVYHYQKDARQTIADISSRGKTPIFVGGTGLYLKAALYDYEFPEEEIQDDFQQWTNEALLHEIQKKEPDTHIHVNNRKRLIRRLIQLRNGKTHHQQKDRLLYPSVFIGLTLPREILYERINARVDQMFQAGLVEEVKSFYMQGIHSKALQTGIGYKELYDYFDGKCTLEEAKEKIKQNSRHYAKRQMTFFRHQMPVKWFEVNLENFQETIQAVETFIQNL